jgi:hypothetical protein
VQGKATETEEAIDAALQSLGDGEEVKLEVLLDEPPGTREVVTRVALRERSTVELVPMEKATERQLAIRAGLLEGKPGRPTSR